MYEMNTHPVKADLRALSTQYGQSDCRSLNAYDLEQLRNGLKGITKDTIQNIEDAKRFLKLVALFRQALAESDKLKGDNYPDLLKSLLTVGEDSVYSTPLRFIFELIQNVDDCDFPTPEDCRLDIHFDSRTDTITLKYNEVGFTPFNVFAITGIAEAAKNVSSDSTEIGEKGIGFKSVFGVADKVLIRSGWFSFALYKNNFTVPVEEYTGCDFCQGTELILYVSSKADTLYNDIKSKYCTNKALFNQNPLLFLNKLTMLTMRLNHSAHRMEFSVNRLLSNSRDRFIFEKDVFVEVNVYETINGQACETKRGIRCARFTYPVIYSYNACQARYGGNTKVGMPGGCRKNLQVVFPYPEYIAETGKGNLYSYLPTKLSLTVPMACHIPFKLDPPREYVESQGNNTWFSESCRYFSELLDYAYRRWSRIVGTDIVRYLPAATVSIIAPNNGKEECLSKKGVFRGAHFLESDLFLSTGGTYHCANDVFSFETALPEPQKVFRLLDHKKNLFIPPDGCSVKQFGIEIETASVTYDALFKKALRSVNIMQEAVDYLDSVLYNYTPILLETKRLMMTAEQLSILCRNDNLYEAARSIACGRVKKAPNALWLVAGSRLQTLKQTINIDFSTEECSSVIADYLDELDAQCSICLDIGEKRYMPCENALILSSSDSLSAFIAFCYDLNPNDTFSVRMRLREVSNHLNAAVISNSGTPGNYIKDLANYRMMVKDALGEKGYNSFVDLILRAGTNKDRFVQELLQNADDCEYPKNAVPTFSLKQSALTIVTEYNEVGFTRDNIRSITAIGESTKNDIISGNTEKIGAKGVGFKTVFGVASEVIISSGLYHFSLTDKTPTIPKVVPATGAADGTVMQLVFKDRYYRLALQESRILELCMCLRQLKRLNIGGKRVEIEDDDTERTITIGGKRYSFKKFIHPFIVNNEETLAERSHGNMSVNRRQQIVCYIPQDNAQEKYPLYVGLPSNHTVGIPMIIDAPFELTTSREYIDEDCAKWNTLVRREMYTAILDVMLALSETERDQIFRFVKYRSVPQTRNGRQAGWNFYNDFSDSEFLKGFDFLSLLKGQPILPTYAPRRFSVPDNQAVHRYPDAVLAAFDLYGPGDFGAIKPDAILQADNQKYDTVLTALGYPVCSFITALSVLEKNTNLLTQNEDARKKLYEYLRDNATPDYYDRVRRMRIIPVYDNGDIRFTDWQKDKIFVEHGQSHPGNYLVLATDILSKADCEKILGVNVNEMNEQSRQQRYLEQLDAILDSDSPSSIYAYLLGEYKSGNLRRYHAEEKLCFRREKVALKNELGEISFRKLFVSREAIGFYQSPRIQAAIAGTECKGLAEMVKAEPINSIHYEDIPDGGELTEYDVDTICSSDFVNRDEILLGFFRDGLLPEALMVQFGIEYIQYSGSDDVGRQYLFPEKPIVNRTKLLQHIENEYTNPGEVVSVIVERSIRKAHYSNGYEIELDSENSRQLTLDRYAPIGERNKCFCQMCGKVKPYSLMEVNCLEKEPRFYFPEMYIALCLECSKMFEAQRANKTICGEYLDAIRTTAIGNEGKISVPLRGGKTLTFSATHLFEIRELLKFIGSL